MTLYNNISKIIKHLTYNSKQLIINNVSFFLSLIFLNSLILIFVMLITIWINDNIPIFELKIGIILLRFALFCLFSGIWIGYFRLVFNFIDKKTILISSLFKAFDILPQFILIRLLSYISLLPVIGYVLYKFPYNFDEYGINIGEYCTTLLFNLSNAYYDEISWQLYSAYFNSLDIIIIFLLALIPCWYAVRFWCAELLIIDKEYSIKDSLITSYSITSNISEFILLSGLLMLLNIFFMVLGYLFFMVSLTLSYLILFQYFRYLLFNVNTID